MAKQLINVGSSPNDKTGDGLRTSFTKTNNNINELYSSINDLNYFLEVAIRSYGIRRWTLSTNATLLNTDVYCQHIISTSINPITINLPSSPYIGLQYLVVNSLDSISDIIFSSELLGAGERHAVQWDGVVWLMM